jgi:3'(2'), 5'-bisphosphate nucleotidase
LCAEEGAETANAGASRVWVVDPIDGTRGFAMKNGEFSVMIALTVDREPVVGVVLEPTHDRLTYATKGGGCWTQTGDAEPARCRVRAVADPSACVLVQSRPKRGESPTPPVRAVGPAKVLEMYSAGVKMAVVARGEADTYVNTYPNFHDWDVCAGHILVTEAGGRVTGLRGEPVVYGRPGFTQRVGLVASSAAIHNTIIDRLRTK